MAMIVDVTVKANDSAGEGHQLTQANTMLQLRECGITRITWISGVGTQYHVWRAVVSDEEATMLALKFACVSTQYYNSIINSINEAKSAQNVLAEQIKRLEDKLAGKF